MLAELTLMLCCLFTTGFMKDMATYLWSHLKLLPTMSYQLSVS